MANELHKKADDLLARIAEAEKLIDDDTKAMAAEIEAIKEKYDSIDYWSRIASDLKKDLVTLMKKNVAEIFDDRDHVELDHGILLHGSEPKVKIPRDAVEKIEAQGWNEAIVISKSVDRSVVEKWPIERLAIIGAERKPKETFEYELKEYGTEGRE